jgi:hypothetical protein
MRPSKKEVTMKIDDVIAMTIIAMGQPDGDGFEYFPKLPRPFTENVMFKNRNNRIYFADFLRLRVNDQLRVECWFITENEEKFYIELNDIKKTNPLLYVCIFTHIFDMIENVKED